jgi:hypothetical protein
MKKHCTLSALPFLHVSCYSVRNHGHISWPSWKYDNKRSKGHRNQSQMIFCSSTKFIENFQLLRSKQTRSNSNKNMEKKIAPAGNRTRVCTVAGYYSTTRPPVPTSTMVSPLPGIEPGSPAWQAGILTTILQRQRSPMTVAEGPHNTEDQSTKDLRKCQLQKIKRT